MLLTIQKDEALVSYISRFILLFPKHENTSLLQSIYWTGSRKWKNEDILVIAKIFGWNKPVEFMKILHGHTRYPEVSFINVFSNTAGSNKTLDSFRRYGCWEQIGLCIECAKSDIAALGFAYWRRSHQFPNEICASHNIKLLRSCPFCRLWFSAASNKKHLNLLWDECSCGNNIVTGKPELVENEAKLKINKFFVGLYNNQYQVDGVIAYRAILQKLKSDGYRNIYSLYSDAPLLWRNAIEHTELIVKRGPPRCLEDIYSARWLIFLLFEDLQEFFSYCREQLFKEIASIIV